MPNIAGVLKDEITRLARKEVVRQTQNLLSAVTGYRSQIAGLKRRNQALERQVRRLEPGLEKSETASKDSEEEGAFDWCKGACRTSAAIGGCQPRILVL